MQATLLDTKPINANRVRRSKSQVIELLRGVVDERQASYIADQRGDRRYPLCVPVEVTPYDVKGQRSGEPFTAVTEDVSAGGMAFLHRYPTREQIVAISFPQSDNYADDRIILQVTRRRAVGPLWEIAGRFITESE